MSVVDEPSIAIQTFADLWSDIGEVPLDRILMDPPPGRATEADVLRHLESAYKRICELVDGVLIEKPMGVLESAVAIWVAYFIRRYLESNDLGVVLGTDGPLRLQLNLVRFPDVCFISWDRFPGRKLPKKAIADLAADLAIEILSKSNTPKEMNRKLQDYFDAGTKLVWYVDAKTRSA